MTQAPSCLPASRSFASLLHTLTNATRFSHKVYTIATFFSELSIYAATLRMHIVTHQTQDEQLTRWR